MNKKAPLFIMTAAAILLTACMRSGTTAGGQTGGNVPEPSAVVSEDTKNDLTDSASLPEDTKEAEPMVITKAIKFNKGTVKNSVQGMSVSSFSSTTPATAMFLISTRAVRIR